MGLLWLPSGAISLSTRPTPTPAVFQAGFLDCYLDCYGHHTPRHTGRDDQAGRLRAANRFNCALRSDQGQ
jgi:hypothetical protein